MKKHTQRKTIAVAIINKVFKEMDTDGLEVKTNYAIGNSDKYRIELTKGDKKVRIALGPQDYSWEVCSFVFCKWNSEEEETAGYPYYVADIVNHIVTYVIRKHLEP